MRLLGGVVLAASGVGCGQPTTPLGHLPPGDKVDPRVYDAFAAGASAVPVLILGSRQVLAPPDGFETFVAEHGDIDRRDLRRTMLAALEELADEEQPVIVGALPEGAFRGRLWVVNAVVAVLHERELAPVTALEGVGYVYAVGTPAPAAGALDATWAHGATASAHPATQVAPRVSWNLDSLRVPLVWQRGVTGTGTVVAVLDQGVNVTHPDLRANLWINPGELAGNGLDDDGNAYVDDVHGFNFRDHSSDVRGADDRHGTWVAGIIAGSGAGGIRTGVAPGARLMPLTLGSFHHTALAFQYALAHGADVINMSFSLPDLGDFRAVWRLMCEQAVAAGVVLVSGAANFRQTASPPRQLRVPEDIPAVIAVGGVDRAMRVTPFSSMGPVEWASVRFYGTPRSLVKPDVAAFPGPGYPVLAPGGSGYIDPNTAIYGNSFSGPHAAGVAALILSAAPSLPAWRVKEVLEATARGPGDKDTDVGYGVIDAAAAVELVRGGTGVGLAAARVGTTQRGQR